MKLFSLLLLSGVLVFGALGAGCTNMSKTQQGALSGAAVGAAAGWGVSALTGGSATTGALIGGGLGALAGGVHGNNKEKHHYRYR
jgi:osmotically inducible lipoprotein OsmB